MQQTGDRVGKLNVTGINASSTSDVMQISRLMVLPSVPSQAIIGFAAVDLAHSWDNPHSPLERGRLATIAN